MKITLKVVVAAASLLNGLAWAAGACSPAVGKVTLNEYNYIDNFTEIKRLDTSVSLTGWKVRLVTSQRATTKTLPSTGADACFGGAYQVQTYAANEIGTSADIVLLDNNDDVVDILRVRTDALPVSTTYYGPKPACSFIGATTDLQVTSGSKGADRFADGNGDWRQTPGTGNNSLQSRCAPNLAGGNADLSVTKTVSSSSVVRGTDVTFTVRVANAGTGIASNVLVNDLLPAGLSYSSHTTTSGSYSASTGVWTIGTLAVGGAATLNLTATTTVAGVLTNTATVASGTFDPNTANNTASVSVTVTSPGATLDAVEVAAAAGTSIHTKLAGTSFNLDLLALDSGGNIATTYNRTVTIELVDSASSSICASRTLLQTVGTYTFTGSGAGRDNGRKTYTFTYANAAPNVRVRLRDNNSTPITACSTDNFSIRPLALTVSSSNANADATGTSTTATPALQSGTNFSLTATAVDGAATPATLTGYAGTPGIDPASVQAHGAAPSVGTVAGSFSPATAGAASGSTFIYSEVGYFRAAATGIYDDTFTSVDQGNGGCTNDFSNTMVGGRYGCKFGNLAATRYFGRFIPARLVISSSSLTNACTSATAYTYFGEDGFTTAFTLTAQNTAGVTTANYTGSYAKLGLTTWANFGFTAATLPAGATLSTGATPPSGTWNNGVASITAKHQVSRPTALAGETDATVSAAPTDGEIPAASPASALGAVKLRYGRLQLLNAYGSELLVLPMTLRAQYWNGTAWATNSDDSCTPVATPTSGAGLTFYAEVAPGASGNHLSAGETTASVNASGKLLSGNAGLRFSAPGVGNNGYVDVTVGLAARPWLRFNWGGAGNVDPTARATFGIYKSRLIYSRENY